MTIDLLDGIRILDLTSVVLGPFATSYLADLGADVLKVESPSGDIYRGAAPARSDGMGGPFMTINHNKRSVGIDLRADDGRDLLLDVVPAADVFVHNMRMGAINRLGIGPEAVRGRNDSIIYCSAIGYGSDGPYADLPAYDDVVQGRVGIPGLMERTTGTPQLAPTTFADKVTGLYAAQAILAALVARERTGAGRTIEVPMFETLTSFVLAEHLAGRTFDPPIGGAGYNRVVTPYRRPYPTADGHVVVLPYSTRHWQALFDEVGFAPEPWMMDRQTRGARVDELYAMLESWMPARTTADWLETFTRLDIPSGPASDVDDLFDDPHLSAVGMFETTDHETEGRIVRIRHPVEHSDTETRPGPGAPRMGAGGREALASFGITDDRIDRLAEAGILIAS